jgi:hypothetical protein
MGSLERTGAAGRGRRLAVVTAVVAAAALALAGCGSGGDTAAAPTTAATATSTSPTTGATSSTATPGAVSGAAAVGAVEDEADDEADDEGGPADPSALGPGDETAADEVAEDVTWSLSATAYRGQEGLLVAYDCPPDGSAGSVWGTDVYTDDSSVCTAAVHLGLITEASGGRVVIQISDGLDAYEGSTENGITTQSYPAWSGSFTFVG